MLRCFVFGMVSSLVSASSFALSLGQVGGQVIVGQRLNVSVPVTLSVNEIPTELCPQVSVSFAEDAVGADQVSVATVWSAHGGALINIRTLRNLNEPYVLLDVRAGCTNSSTRHFVLLAELPTAGPVPTPSNQSQAKPIDFTAGGHGPAASMPRSVPDVVNAPQNDPGNHVGTPTRSSVLLKKSVPTSAHLKLDPMESAVDLAKWVPALKLSRLPLVFEDVPDDELQQRRTNARQLWIALSQSVENSWISPDLHQEVLQKLRQSEAALEIVRQHETQLKEQLLLAQDDSSVNPWIIVLGAFCLVLTGILVMVIRRSRQLLANQRHWWEMDLVRASSSEHPVSLAKRPDGHVSERSNWVGKSSRLDMELDTLFPASSASGSLRPDANPVSTQSPEVSVLSEFMPSTLSEPGRSLATEELFDMQQQVEFFISLGHAELAVEVLVTHLSDGEELSPLAYLDLLKLYHQLKRREAYDALHAQFTQIYGGNVPTYDNFSISRRGLERYTKAITRLQELWPRREVLTVIELSLFHKSSAESDLTHGGEVFDLEAYRELLLLYGIAREIIAENEGSVETAQFNPEPSGRPHVYADQYEEQPVFSSTVTALQPLVAESAPPHPTALRSHATEPMDELEAALKDLSTAVRGVSLPESRTGNQIKVNPPEDEPVVDLVDLDFSELGQLQQLTIKKSGH